MDRYNTIKKMVSPFSMLLTAYGHIHTPKKKKKFRLPERSLQVWYSDTTSGLVLTLLYDGLVVGLFSHSLCAEDLGPPVQGRVLERARGRDGLVHVVVEAEDLVLATDALLQTQHAGILACKYEQGFVLLHALPRVLLAQMSELFMRQTLSHLDASQQCRGWI
jgi:hypothetical protein